MSICIYPGSFDPVTKGHIDIARRAAGLFDEVVFAVLDNRDKHARFSMQQRMQWIAACTQDIPNIRVDSFSGGLLEYARAQHACAVVRGLRCLTDFEYEKSWAMINRELEAQIEIVFLMSDTAYAHVSSSQVRQLGALGLSLERYVPQEILTQVTNALRGAAQ